MDVLAICLWAIIGVCCVYAALLVLVGWDLATKRQSEKPVILRDPNRAKLVTAQVVELRNVITNVRYPINR